MNYEKWLNENAKELRNKKAIIIGGTGILAQATMRHLLTLDVKIVFSYRNITLRNSLMLELLQEFPSAEIHSEYCDLCDKSSIEKFAEKALSYFKQPDYLLNIAGAFNIAAKTTRDGFDNIFQTNFVGPKILCEKVYPKMSLEGKVVFVTSIAAKGYRIQNCDFQALGSGAIKKYANSKKMINYYVATSPFDNMTLAHPGICSTNIVSYKNGGFSKAFSIIASLFLKAFFMPPKKASLSIIKAMLAKNKTISYPRVLEIWGIPRTKQMKLTQRKNAEIVLWQDTLRKYKM